MSHEEQLQHEVWSTPHSLTEHIPGTLKLCVSMSVMLKHNDTMELYAINGAKDKVLD